MPFKLAIEFHTTQHRGDHDAEVVHPIDVLYDTTLRDLVRIVAKRHGRFIGFNQDNDIAAGDYIVLRPYDWNHE